MDRVVWTNRIVDHLWQRDERRLNEHLSELIESNAQKGNPACGFLFGGAFHSLLPFKDRRAAEKRLLHKDLHPAGRAYLADLASTEKEKIRITNGLGLLLQGCQGLQDIRDALPDTIVALFPELSSMSRIREEGWPFRDRPLQAESNKTTTDLLNFYAANQLLY